MLRRTQTHGPVAGRILRLLTVVCLAGSMQTIMPVNAAETGIRGTVVWGPLGPGPVSAGQSDEAPLRAAFQIMSTERKVARFESDQKGHFEVSLPPGEYTIVPDKSTPIPFPERQKMTVTVPEDGFAVITVRLDTGMR